MTITDDKGPSRAERRPDARRSERTLTQGRARPPVAARQDINGWCVRIAFTDSADDETDELVIRADRVEFRAGEAVFHLAAEPTHTFPVEQITSLSWGYRRATRTQLARRTGAWWTAAESDRLRQELEAGCSWEQIADCHDRSVYAVQRQAMKVGLLRPEAAQLRIGTARP